MESLWEELEGVFGKMSIVDEEETAEDTLLQKQFEERLLSNPHYFVGWFGDELGRMGEKEALQFVDSLFAITRRPRTKSQMEKLEFNASKSYEVVLGFFVEAYAIAAAKRRFIPKAYSLNELGKSYAIDLVAQGMDPEYLPGVRYLHRWGQLYVSILKGKLPSCDPMAYDGVNEFQRLSNKAKAFVLGAKCCVLSTHRKVGSRYDAEAALNVLREIVALDPLCYEWHYLLGNWLRQARRRTGGPMTSVSDDEARVLWETYENCDYVKTEGGRNSRLRNRALAGVLQAIAEILRIRLKNVSSAPLTFGDMEFATDADAAAFIVKEIERIMLEEREDNGRPSFAELIRAGEMLSVLLPDGFRNVKTAEKYYLEAMTLKPKNSKLHHKLGLLYLTSDELRDIPKSLEHLRTAWKNEASNIPSAMDLVKTLMADVRQNREEIEDTITSLLNSNKITESDRCQILFVQGSLKFVLGDKTKAVQLWMESDKALGNTISRFNTLGCAVKRYKWNTEDFPYYDIQDAINVYEKLHADSLSPVDFETLLKIRKSPMLRIYRSDQRNGQHDESSSRGRGRSQWRGGHGEQSNWRGGRGEQHNWRGGRGEQHNWRGGRGEQHNWRGGRGEQHNWRDSRGDLGNGHDMGIFRGHSAQVRGSIYRGSPGGFSDRGGGPQSHDRRDGESIQNWRNRDAVM